MAELVREAFGGRPPATFSSRPFLRPAADRFCFAPTHRTWELNISRACRCREDDLVKAWERLPSTPPRIGCWLLPTEDKWALHICRHRRELEQQGWRLLACDEATTVELMDKVTLRSRAERLGVADALPEYYASVAAAKFPCVVKTALGDHGSTVRVARNKQELKDAIKELKLHSRGFGDAWLVQECCLGPVEYTRGRAEIFFSEKSCCSHRLPPRNIHVVGLAAPPRPTSRRRYSCSLVVRDGDILDVARTRYTYAAAAYVWPRVEERKDLRVVDSTLPPDHRAVAEALVEGYSGVCNLNYKVRPDGRLCIFEVNVRCGEDLACDVPPARLRCLLERLDRALPPNRGPAPAVAAVAPPEEGVRPRRPREAPF